MRKSLVVFGLVACALYAISKLPKPRKEETIEEKFERFRLASPECSGFAEEVESVVAV